MGFAIGGATNALIRPDRGSLILGSPRPPECHTPRPYSSAMPKPSWHHWEVYLPKLSLHACRWWGRI